jgi:hypothetical protein
VRRGSRELVRRMWSEWGAEMVWHEVGTRGTIARWLAGAVVALVGLGLLTVPAHGAAPTALSGFSARGIPLQGQVLFGAASGNSSQDPLPQEGVFGGRLGIHRTYWAGNQQSSAVSRAAMDLQAGRLPWVSFKGPGLSWAQMASGAGDAWARDLAAKLGSLPGPVWVAVHHEPENDSGDLQDWKRMQQRLSPIFRAYPNIAFTVILMGYHQFIAPTIDPKLSMQALYPGPGLVDVVGFDPYNWYGTVRSSGEQITTFDELKTYYTKIAAWAASAGGVKWAVAETGYTDLAAQRDVAWLSRAYDDMKAAGGIALTYWDNQTAKPADTFRLTSTLKRTEFAKVLARSDRLSDPPRDSPRGAAGAAPGGKSVSVKVSTRRAGRVMHVNVNPNKGRGFWTFRIQKQRADGSWRDLGLYRTNTRKEVRKVNLPRGTYRVVVRPKYGFAGTTSSSVVLRR